MTANQIEWMKLKETTRHNYVTEEMDKPLKESQTKLNLEQIATYPTIRALNIAQEAAAKASEAAGYATAYERYAAGALDYEKINTEQSSQYLNLAKADTEHSQSVLNLSKAGYTDLSSQQLEYTMPSAIAQGIKGSAQVNYLSFNEKAKNRYAKTSLFTESGGWNLSNAMLNAAKTASMFMY